MNEEKPMETSWRQSSNRGVIIVVLSLLVATGHAFETIETTNHAGIKLSYMREAKLSDLELRQVLDLARQVGITNVASVRTVYGLPGLSKHVIVKSAERVNGRNVSYETLRLSRASWRSGSKPNGVLEPGDFRVEASGEYTTLERTYELGGSTRRVAMLEKDVTVADQVIPLIATRKVRFKEEPVDGGFESARHQFEQINLLEPNVLRKRDSEDEYELEFSKTQHLIYFRYKDGELLITHVGRYVI